ncbi:hypothetical protein KM925_25315 [Priestia megaterium]|uniref:hypothetical protein n=1 Tax=Priestia megaterium TaxID=1404 RepID=UPI001C22A65E|nr:hypothetical protein [Priestia megaterium]MBU8589216.1 hypothetical protein [Priestia megaterium]
MNKLLDYASLNSMLDDYINKTDIDMIKEFISEVTPYVKPMTLIWDYSQKIRYGAFIKGYEHKKDNPRLLNKFQKRMDKLTKNEKFMEFLFQTVSDAINARSSKASFILGMYIAEIIKGEKEIEEPSYENLLIINALKSLNDWDITHFNNIYSFFYEHKEYTKFFCASQIFNRSTIQSDIDMSSSPERAEFKAVIDKLINLQILTTGAAIALDNEGYTVELTYYSGVLHELLKRCNVTI